MLLHGLQHHLNALHFMAHLMRIGLPRPGALVLASWWEWMVHPLLYPVLPPIVPMAVVSPVRLAAKDALAVLTLDTQSRNCLLRPMSLWIPVILVVGLCLPIAVSSASGLWPYQIFWKNPAASDAILCRSIVIRPPRTEDSSGPPFCRAFQQFQVIEVQGAWARIGSDVWIETAVLLDTTLLRRTDPRVPRALAPVLGETQSPTHRENAGREGGLTQRR